MSIELRNQANEVKVDVNTKTQKKPNRNKSDLGPDFVAPDGGWGWVVCVASGFSTFCVFPVVQQYGIIYRDRMNGLGFNAKQITTILNLEMAIGALFGVISGAIFRRFTIRQVGILGGVFVGVGIFLTAFCQTFVQYLISFSFIFGTGLGMNLTATILAINIYFKKYRRRAMGFNQTIIGIGPMIFPYICTYLLEAYGTQGTILIISGIGLNTVVCCCTLQPVLWHVKKARQGNDVAKAAASNATKEQNMSTGDQCKFCRNQNTNENGILTTQYMPNADDPAQPGHALKRINKQMVAHDNDGFIGSKISLAETISRTNNETSDENPMENCCNKEHKDPLRYTSELNITNLERCICIEKRELAQQTFDEKLRHDELKAEQADEAARCEMSFKQKLIKFFDLDLLRDWSFLNLMQGISLAMLIESNFSSLTPFILDSYGYTNSEISFSMSALAAVDLMVRFTAPFVIEKLKFSNKACSAFGIIIFVTGRCFLVMVDSFYPMLAVFMFIGIGKGFRTLFLPLVIPSYVPLDRLAAATGLQLFLKFILTLAIGPMIGVITDLTSYTITIHFINLVMILSLSLWGLEWIIRRWLGKSIKTEE